MKYFTEQTTLTERLREQAYKDPVTAWAIVVTSTASCKHSSNHVRNPQGAPLSWLNSITSNKSIRLQDTKFGDRVLHRAAELIQTRLADFRKLFLLDESPAQDSPLWQRLQQ